MGENPGKGIVVAKGSHVCIHERGEGTIRKEGGMENVRRE